MTPVTRGHRILFATAAAMVFLLVTSGGVVCITDASKGCPDWPVCHGRLIPPAQLNSIIEWSHRVATPLTLPVIIAAAVVAWRRYRPQRWIVGSVLGSIASILAVVVFGAIAVLAHLPRGWAAADLGTALLALGFMVTAATVVSVRFVEPSRGDRLSPRAPGAGLALAAAGSVWAVLVAGVLVARPDSLVRCIGWPSWTDIGAPDDLFGWLALARLGLAAAATVLIALTALRTWRIASAPRALRRDATIAAVLLLATTIAALAVPVPDAGVVVPLINMVFAGLLWSVSVATAVRFAARPPQAA